MKLIAFFVLLASGSAVAQQCCITAYEQINYQGDSRRYCGDASWEQFFSKDFNDKTSSLKIPDCCQVTLYDADYKGRVLVLFGDEPNLAERSFNKVVSSLRIAPIACGAKAKECCIQTFDLPNYQGEIRRYCGAASWESFFQADFNDRITSLSPKLLHSHSAAAIQPVVVNKDIPDLTALNFNNIVSSLTTARTCTPAPTGKCCIDVFDQINFQGESRRYCGDASWEEFFSRDYNDRITSVKVPDCCSVKFYDADYKGRELVLYGDEPNLIERGFNDIISSLRISSEACGAQAKQCCVQTFDEANYKGEIRRYCNDASWESFFSKDFNDRITSLKLPQCCSVTLYDADFKAAAIAPVVIDKNIPDLTPLKFNNIVSSLKTARACTAPPTGQCCVDTYEHVNYQGETRRYCGDASWEQFFSKDFNDKISSVKIPECCSVTLYDADFKGRDMAPITLNKNTPDLTVLKFNDVVSSLKTTQTCKNGQCCVDAFEHVNYQGETRRYCGDASWEEYFSKDFNDKISSVKVPACCTVTLFDADFKGRDMAPITLNKDTPDLTVLKFNDVVSSLKTANNGCATKQAQPAGQCCIEAFDQVDFKGDSRRYCGDSSWEQFFSKDFNDRISSVKVPDCCSVKLYDADYKGRELVLVGNEPNLIERGFNDIISSLKISPNACGAKAKECCIQTFDLANYQGEIRRYCGDASWENFFSKDFNDRISSFKVQGCCAVTLYDADFKRVAVDPATLNKDTPDLTPHKMDNVISSLKVAPGECALGTTCDVHEPSNIPHDLCPDASGSKCHNYCRAKFGMELLKAECSAPRANKQRECVCRLKCCNQGCWGDPHCWTCDGVKFGYQGLKKHYMLKPVEDHFPTLPYFTISQTNKKWQNGPMAILDTSEVFIRDWKLTITVKTPEGPTGQFSLKVNENAENIPWRFSKVHGHRETFANVAFGNDQKTQVVLTTSFGLRIVYTTQGAGNDRYTDLSVDTPRHPELKNHLHGLLGRWNDNPDDDSVDANGKKQPLDDAFSWAFGDSFIVPGGRTPTADCVRDGSRKEHESHVGKIDPKIKEAAEKACKEALNRPGFTDCARKLNRAIPMQKNCVVDLIFLNNDDARKKYINEMVASFEETCKRREKARQEKERAKDEEAVGLSL